MAWHIKNGENGDVIWHNGGTGGYRSFAGFVKETGKGVILLTNSSAADDDIGFYLLDPGSELYDPNFASDAIELPESTLEQYVGLYEMKPEDIFTIKKEGNVESLMLYQNELSLGIFVCPAGLECDSLIRVNQKSYILPRIIK